MGWEEGGGFEEFSYIVEQALFLLQGRGLGQVAIILKLVKNFVLLFWNTRKNKCHCDQGGAISDFSVTDRRSYKLSLPSVGAWSIS